jgi:uncharacterized membrane protein (DUF4010 family)
VLNPFKIWLMVVLIVAISLCGYVAFKLAGGRAGALIGGILGGLVSSTATTASFARLSRGERNGAPIFAALIVLASSVVFARVLILIAAAAAPALPGMVLPLAVMLGVMMIFSGAVYFFTRNRSLKSPEPENPAELKPALIFGTLYAAVVLVVEIARHHFGSAGLYVVAALAGLTDLDAITLSTSQLVASAQLDADAGWRAILIASLSNMVFKTAMVAALGTRTLFAWIAIPFALAVAIGVALVSLWPT